MDITVLARFWRLCSWLVRTIHWSVVTNWQTDHFSRQETPFLVLLRVAAGKRFQRRRRGQVKGKGAVGTDACRKTWAISDFLHPQVSKSKVKQRSFEPFLFFFLPTSIWKQSKTCSVNQHHACPQNINFSCPYSPHTYTTLSFFGLKKN